MRLTLARIAQFALATVVSGCGTAPTPTQPTPATEPPPATATHPASKTLELGPVAIQTGNPNASQTTDPDVLPPGAVLRLGSEQGKPSKGWGGAVLLPTGTRVFAPHSLQQPHSFQHFTLYDVDGLKPVGPATLAETNAGGQIGSPHSVSADGTRLASVNINTLEVHDLTTGKRIFQVPRPASGLSSIVSLSADGKRVATGGGAAQATATSPPVACVVWDVATGKEISRVTVLQNAAASVSLSPDGKTLITSGQHRDFSKLNDADYPEKISQIWDVDTKAELARVKWSLGSQLVFSPDSRTVAVTSYSPRQLLLADARTGAIRHSLDVKTVGLGALVFTHDSKELAIVTSTQATRCDVATGVVTKTTPCPADLPAGVPAYGAAFDPTGRLIAFGYRDLSAFCWDASAGKVLTPTGNGHAGPVRTVAFTPDGAEVRTAGADGAVLRWAADNGKLLGRYEVRKPDDSNAANLRLAGDGHLAVLGTTCSTLDGKNQPVDFREVLKPDGFANGTFPTADGSLVTVVGPLFGDKPARCLVYDVASNKAAGEVRLPAGLIRVAAAVSKDRKKLVTAYSTKLVNNKTDVVVTGWELPTDRKLGEYTLPDGGGVCGVAFLDDKRAVVATGTGHVKIVDVETGVLQQDLADPSRLACLTLAVSRDGKQIAVGHTGRQPAAKYVVGVRVYGADGVARHTITGGGIFGDTLAYYNAASSPEAMAFSPDGTRLAVPALTTVLVWDLSKVGADGTVR